MQAAEEWRLISAISSAPFLVGFPPVRAEGQFGFVLIVTPTVKGDVSDRGRPLFRVRLNVVEFQEDPLRASSAGGRNEGALAGIALPGPALDHARDVARANCGIRPGTDRRS
jgi:hypothetical protein